jgi:hypothetical protein
MKKIIFALACFCSFLAITTFTSCKKDPLETNKDLLQDKKWKLTALTFNGADAFVKLDACAKDDTETYKADGSWIGDEGATKCKSTDPQTETFGTWALSNEGKTLTSTNTASKEVTTATVKELTATTLVTESTESLLGINITIVSTYAKQ